MSKIYRQCTQIRAAKGKSAHVMRCEAFEQSVCEANGVFMEIRQGVLRACEKILDNHKKVLVAKVDAVYLKIQHDFDTVCSTQGDDSAEGKEFRHKLRNLVPEAREILTGPVRDCLEQCRLFKG